jgi:hypothetical protein
MWSRVWSVALCVGWALACAGGEPAAPPPEPVAAAPIQVEREPPTPVPTGDPVLDAYLADCRAVLPPEDPALGADECRVFRGLPEVAGDRFGCYDQAQVCGSGCGTTCDSCQQECGTSCEDCMARCEDSDCLTWCAENRASCRLLCTRSQSECARDCVEDYPRCNQTAAEQLHSECPHCTQIGECLTDRKKREICQQKFPEDDVRCFTWCAQSFPAR